MRNTWSYIGLNLDHQLIKEHHYSKIIKTWCGCGPILGYWRWRKQDERRRYKMLQILVDCLFHIIECHQCSYIMIHIRIEYDATATECFCVLMLIFLELDTCTLCPSQTTFFASLVQTCGPDIQCTHSLLCMLRFSFTDAQWRLWWWNWFVHQ